MVTVTAKIKFFYSGREIQLGEKLRVKQEVASRLASQGMIESEQLPVIDKMMWVPRKIKTKGAE